MVYGTVYRLFNTRNGKSYTGQTVQRLEERWKQHLDKMKDSEKPLYRAMRFYGPESFVMTPVCQAYSQEELDRAEVYFGELFDSLAPDGYCLKLGEGLGRHCEATKEKIRAKRRSQDEKNGNRSPRTGTGKRPKAIFPCGIEFVTRYDGRWFHDQKCYARYEKENMAQRWAAVGIARGKKVRDTETGIEYPSIRAAACDLGVDRTKIRDSLSKDGRFVYVKKGGLR